MLKSLDDHNKERQQMWNALHGATAARPNGLACPTCGIELMDTNPFETLTSFPAKKAIHCKCGYRGHRLA